eukprot:ANDGO_07042.mRNA.1 hypothetical protein
MGIFSKSAKETSSAAVFGVALENLPRPKDKVVIASIPTFLARLITAIHDTTLRFQGSVDPSIFDFDFASTRPDVAILMTRLNEGHTSKIDFANYSIVVLWGTLYRFFEELPQPIVSELDTKRLIQRCQSMSPGPQQKRRALVSFFADVPVLHVVLIHCVASLFRKFIESHESLRFASFALAKMLSSSKRSRFIRQKGMSPVRKRASSSAAPASASSSSSFSLSSSSTSPSPMVSVGKIPDENSQLAALMKSALIDLPSVIPATLLPVAYLDSCTFLPSKVTAGPSFAFFASRNASQNDAVPSERDRAVSPVSQRSVLFSSAVVGPEALSNASEITGSGLSTTLPIAEADASVPVVSVNLVGAQNGNPDAGGPSTLSHPTHSVEFIAEIENSLSETESVLEDAQKKTRVNIERESQRQKKRSDSTKKTPRRTEPFFSTAGSSYSAKHRSQSALSSSLNKKDFLLKLKEKNLEDLRRLEKEIAAASESPSSSRQKRSPSPSPANPPLRFSSPAPRKSPKKPTESASKKAKARNRRYRRRESLDFRTQKALESRATATASASADAQTDAISAKSPVPVIKFPSSMFDSRDKELNDSLVSSDEDLLNSKLSNSETRTADGSFSSNISAMENSSEQIAVEKLLAADDSAGSSNVVGPESQILASRNEDQRPKKKIDGAVHQESEAGNEDGGGGVPRKAGKKMRKSRTPSPSFGERLYLQGLESKRKVEQFADQTILQRRKEEEENADCTFKPQISELGKRMHPDFGAIISEKRRAEIETLHLEEQRKLREQCTFKPHISSKSLQLAVVARKRHASVERDRFEHVQQNEPESVEQYRDLQRKDQDRVVQRSASAMRSHHASSSSAVNSLSETRSAFLNRLVYSKQQQEAALERIRKQVWKVDPATNHEFCKPAVNKASENFARGFTVKRQKSIDSTPPKSFRASTSISAELGRDRPLVPVETKNKENVVPVYASNGNPAPNSIHDVLYEESKSLNFERSQREKFIEEMRQKAATVLIDDKHTSELAHQRRKKLWENIWATQVFPKSIRNIEGVGRVEVVNLHDLDMEALHPDLRSDFREVLSSITVNAETFWKFDDFFSYMETFIKKSYFGPRQYLYSGAKSLNRDADKAQKREKSPSLGIVERLYEREVARRRSLSEARATKLDDLLKQCTFRPRLLPTSREFQHSHGIHSKYKDARGAAAVPEPNRSDFLRRIQEGEEDDGWISDFGQHPPGGTDHAKSDVRFPMQSLAFAKHDCAVGLSATQLAVPHGPPVDEPLCIGDLTSFRSAADAVSSQNGSIHAGHGTEELGDDDSSSAVQPVREVLLSVSENFDYSSEHYPRKEDAVLQAAYATMVRSSSFETKREEARGFSNSQPAAATSGSYACRLQPAQAALSRSLIAASHSSNN